MTERIPDRPSDIPPLQDETDELGPAIRDVSYQLVHDFSDTRDNIEDAVAFAPLALVKMVERGAHLIASWPKQVLVGIGGLAGAALAIVIFIRRKR